MYYFYAFNKERFILITSLDREKVKKRFGMQFEFLQSVKDESAIELIKSRIQKQYPTFQIKTQLFKGVNFTPEIREKLRQAKLGVKRPEHVKQKISQSRKGVGNFAGKKHTEEAKKAIAIGLTGNKNVRGTNTYYHPQLDREFRLRTKITPPGFVKGREPYIKELTSYYFKKYVLKNKISTTPPTRKQPTEDQ